MRIRLCLLLALASGPVLSQRLLDDASYFEMEKIDGVRISPDGRFVVFARGRVDKVKDREQSSLWLAHADGSRLRESTGGSWRDTDPVWSPDGTRIAFLSDRDGTDQIHVLWVDTGDVAQLSHVQERPGNLTWSPDSKRLAFEMLVPSKESPLAIALPDAPQGADRAKPAVVIDRLSWRMDGAGALPKAFRHVFVLDALTGGTPRQVTGGDYNHGSPAWSRDGAKLYVSGVRKPDAEYVEFDSEIYEVDLASSSVRALTGRKGADNMPKVSPDGQWIAYTGHDDRNLTYHIDDLHVMRADGSGKRRLASGLPDNPYGVHWAADSSGVYFAAAEGGTSNVWFAPLDGEARRTTSGNHFLRNLSIANTGRAAAVRGSSEAPGSLVLFDAAGSRGFDKLVDVNSDVMEGRQLGDVEELWAESSDGLKVQGWLVKPARFEPDKKYPLVLWIHGGPWSRYTVEFDWIWQHWAAKGYGVLYTNPRGSTGYGQEFVNGIQYAYPGKDYDDLMASVAAAVAQGWVDERNLFVCGISGGGVLTAWTVGHTDRFRAAATMRPVIDWHSFVGTTDAYVRMWHSQFRKRPWEDPMEYALRSPLHYVANVTTPTLVMTGEEDLRTPIGQSEEFYRALKLLKKETLLVRFPEEYHGFRRPSHSLANQLYLLAWFEKYRVRDGAPGAAPPAGQ